MELGLFQADVAHILGVCVDTITNWENNRVDPQMKSYLAIINFLNQLPFES